MRAELLKSFFEVCEDQLCSLATENHFTSRLTQLTSEEERYVKDDFRWKSFENSLIMLQGNTASFSTYGLGRNYS